MLLLAVAILAKYDIIPFKSSTIAGDFHSNMLF